MLPTSVILFTFCCVTHLYCNNSIQHLNIEPLRGSVEKTSHLIPRLKPGATDLLSLWDKDNIELSKNLQPKSPL